MPRAQPSLVRTLTLSAAAILLAAATLLPAAAACRPKFAVAVHHSGRALGQVALPSDPDLAGRLFAGPPPGVAERASSVRPAGLASLHAMALEGQRLPMNYNGGGVLAHPITVYYLYYGAWGGPDANAEVAGLVEHFTRWLGPSRWWALTTAYADALGRRPSQTVRYGGAAYDAYSRGTALSDDAIAGVVVDAIRKGALPDDPEGVYVVLGSADVDATSGFCVTYCGFHKVLTLPEDGAFPPSTSRTSAAAPTARSHRFYAYVGDPARCGELCRMQKVGPNGPSPADAMVSLIAHELFESSTDPYADAWYDASGLEGPDKCLWMFGRTYTAPGTAAAANMELGGRHFLIQSTWAAGGDGVGRCVIE